MEINKYINISIISRKSSAYPILINTLQQFLNFFKPAIEEENFTSVVYRAMRNNRIKVTISSVLMYLKSHPDYPSLKSICDFLNEIDVLNYAFRIDESDLYSINDPFIAYSKESGGKVLLIYSINENHINYADSLIGRKIGSTKNFLKNWGGVVIVIEPTEQSGEVDYSEKKKNEIVRNALLPSVIFLIILAAIFGIVTNKTLADGSYGVSFFIILVTHFIGLFFSFLLIGHELNFKTKFTDKLCHIATNADCDAVTKSKASRIFGSITWADAGIAYFIGGLMILFLLPVTNSLNNISIIALIALPYPVFSIMYQWLKIRKWCPLCISVQFIIILESVIAINNLKFDELWTAYLMTVLIIFSIVFLVVLLFKFLFISDREKEYIKLELLKMKRDPEVFISKLKKGERVDIPYNKSALLFGDMKSEVLISVFLSFHCSACAKRFDSIMKLIAQNYKIKVQLIFSPSKDEMSVMLLRTIFRLIKLGQNNIVLELLEKWYNTDLKLRSKLLKKYNISEENKGIEDLINYNTRLFNLGKVAAVPSVYVNGYPLPDRYTLEDIKYHIFKLEKMKHKLAKIEI